MRTKSGNLQWVKQKPASIWFSGHKNTHETATNSQKRRFLVIHVPLRVPDSVWPVCPREPPPATLVHTCPGESTPPLTAKRNGVAFPILPATNHNESNESPASIPFGRLSHRNPSAITSLTP